MLSSTAAPLLVDKIKSYSSIVSLKGLPGKSALSDFQKRGLTIKHGRSSSLYIQG